MAAFILNRCNRSRWVVIFTPWPLCPRAKNPRFPSNRCWANLWTDLNASERSKICFPYQVSSLNSLLDQLVIYSL